MLILATEYMNTAAQQAVSTNAATANITLATNVAVLVNIDIVVRQQCHESYADLSIDIVASVLVESGS